MSVAQTTASVTRMLGMCTRTLWTNAQITQDVAIVKRAKFEYVVVLLFFTALEGNVFAGVCKLARPTWQIRILLECILFRPKIPKNSENKNIGPLRRIGANDYWPWIRCVAGRGILDYVTRRGLRAPPGTPAPSAAGTTWSASDHCFSVKKK